MDGQRCDYVMNNVYIYQREYKGNKPAPQGTGTVLGLRKNATIKTYYTYKYRKHTYYINTINIYDRYVLFYFLCRLKRRHTGITFVGDGGVDGGVVIVVGGGVLISLYGA